MTKSLTAALAALIMLVASAQPSFAGSKPTSKEETKTTTVKKSEEKKTPAKHAVQLSQGEERLVNAVNEYRAKKGLEPLTVDPALMQVGRKSAPYFSHNINGKWCWTRAHEAGFAGWATDDIANGYESPEEAVQGWATSDGHAHQMRGHFKMNGQWRDYKMNRIGVGISGRKYIAIFGRSDE